MTRTGRAGIGAPVRASACWGVLVLALSACSGNAAVIPDNGLYVIDPDNAGVATILSDPDGVWFYRSDLSPDGARIAYSGVFWWGEPGAFAGGSGLFVAGSDGSDPVQLSADPAWPRVWLADGSGLVYSGAGGLVAVFMEDFAQTRLSSSRPHTIVVSAGGNVVHFDGVEWVVSALDGTTGRLIATLSPEQRHDWSLPGRDPTHIAYNSADGLLVSALDGEGAPLRLGEGAVIQDWSPDGTRLLYTTVGGRLHMADPGTGRQWTVGGTEQVQDATWSPDGALIAYTAAPDDEPPDDDASDGEVEHYRSVEELISHRVGGDDPGRGTGLFVSRPDGRGRRLVAGGAISIRHRSHWWFGDSRKIAYVADYDDSGGEPQAEAQLWVYDLDTGDRRLLTGGLLAYGRNLRLEPSGDGRRFWYESKDGAFVTDGDNETRMDTDTPPPWLVRWSPDAGRVLLQNDAGRFVADARTGQTMLITPDTVGSASWSHDSRKLAWTTTEGVYVTDLDTGTPRRLAAVTEGLTVPIPYWALDDDVILVKMTPSPE